jgi:hypothetical protein
VIWVRSRLGSVEGARFKFRQSHYTLPPVKLRARSTVSRESNPHPPLIEPLRVIANKPRLDEMNAKEFPLMANLSLSFSLTVLGLGTLVANLIADPLDQWSWRNPLPQGNTLWAIACGGNAFMAVGKVGTILASPDGITWANRYWGGGNGLNGVAYGNNTFVAVGGLGSGVIMTSPDGITWTSHPSGAGNELAAIAYGNNEFVAVGYGGTVLSSLDGINWTRRTSGTDNDLFGVAYGSNTFLAVGARGTILQSAPLTSTGAPPVVKGSFTSGRFTLTIAGTTDQVYGIQAVDDLSGNTLWQTLVTLTLTNSPLIWGDNLATNRSRRFYRAMTLP